MSTRRLIENIGRALLVLVLLWIPLPFGSVTRIAQAPIVLGGIAVGVAALASLLARNELDRFRLTPLLAVSALGAIVLITVAAFQLVPLPHALLRVLSPSSFEIWQGARSVHELLGGPGPRVRFDPVSIDPRSTALHLARLFGYLSLMVGAAILIRQRSHRMLLVIILGLSATFQVVYGLEQWASGSRTIWGWENRLIHDRVTGTFVNPNHFAHYLAIVLPLGIYLLGRVWLQSGRRGMPLPRLLARLIERHFFASGMALLLMAICLGGILVAQSRGALLSVFLSVGTLLALRISRATPAVPRQRMSPHRRRRLQLARVATIVFAILMILVGSFAFWIGAERTMGRFIPSSEQVLGLLGRLIGIRAALGIWLQFPLLGSGLGTFDRVVLMTQSPGFDRVFTHAHNDYLELLATTGLLGFVPALLALIVSSALLFRAVFGDRRGSRSSDADAPEPASEDHRMFQTAALASLGAAMIHALLDFNFFIPANPATLAVILGAAAATPRPVMKPEADEESPEVSPGLVGLLRKGS